MAIRKPDGELYLETWETGANKWYNKTPILRGICNFIAMLITGYTCLMKSAEISGFAEEEGSEPSKFDAWVDKHLGDSAVYIFNVIVTVLAMAIAIGLFMLLPDEVVISFDVMHNRRDIDISRVPLLKIIAVLIL